MTYKTAKDLLLKIIDEVKPQKDTLDKLRDLFDLGQKEIALYYPICKTLFYEENDKKLLPDDCFKAINVTNDFGNLSFIIQDKKIVCREDCFMLQYSAKPASLPDKPQEDFIFEIADEALMALVLFVAAQLNNNDDSQGAYQSYWSQYQNKLQNLCAAPNCACAVVHGGGVI